MLLWGTFSFAGKAARGHAERTSLPVDIISRQGILRDDQGREERAQGRDAEAAGREDAEEPPNRSKIRRPKITEKKEAAGRARPKRRRRADSRRRSPEAKPEKKSPPKVDPIAEPEEGRREGREADRKAEGEAAAQQPSRSRSSTPTRSRRCSTSASRNANAAAGHGAQQRAFAWERPTAGRAAVAERDRCAARALDGECWSPPVGVRDPHELIVNVHCQASPRRPSGGAAICAGQRPPCSAMASRESAVRAVLTGQPFDMLRPEHYEQLERHRDSRSTPATCSAAN